MARDRRRDELRTQFVAVGCADCRRTLVLFRWRIVLLVVLGVCMLTVIPLALWALNEMLGALTFIVGWWVPTLFGAFVLQRFSEYFTRAFVSDDGRELIISRPHPDYARAAVEAGAEYRPDGPRVPRDNWIF